VLVIILLAWPLLSSLLTSGGPDELADKLTNRSVQIYLPTCAIQLLILSTVLIAARREIGGIRSLGFTKLSIGKIFLGLAFFMFAGLVLSLAALFLQSLGATDFKDPSILLPVSFGERVVWTIMSAVVAISEETAFRGYALTRLEHITRRKTLAAILASLGFAIGHSYQGVSGVVVIFIYGLMFAAVFYKTKSIWPGIVAHFMQDFTAMFAVDTLKRMQGG
jgi:membrane protease YdiL (CAAX protease family)